MIYGLTSDDGIEANCKEDYSLPLRDLPRGPIEPRPHAVQAALAADGNGVPTVRLGPIEVGSNGDGEELLAHPPGIALRRQIQEEELTL